eukprot:666281-Prymnesium_polylepis.1
MNLRSAHIARDPTRDRRATPTLLLRMGKTILWGRRVTWTAKRFVLSQGKEKSVRCWWSEAGMRTMGTKCVKSYACKYTGGGSVRYVPSSRTEPLCTVPVLIS